MRTDTSDAKQRRYWVVTMLSTAVATLVSACKSVFVAEPVVAEPSISAQKPEPPLVICPIPITAGSARSSGANTPRAYRQDGASHLYGLNMERIYKGKLPPLLYAIAVLNVNIDRVGRVTSIDWTRAPRHAPEVMAEIERTIRQASPFPAPAKLGKVAYTDTWLWHKSGKFQLDTLTEGQD